MQFIVLLSLVGSIACQGNSKTQGKYVYDLLKPALSSDEIATLEMSKNGMAVYPTYATVPQTPFSCSSKAQAGFYADVDAQCQVFHRCEYGTMNQTDYLCVNTTVFNQITLVCDMFYNVDCPSSIDYENFANSRLYTNQPLFDTPPADYVAPSQLVLMKNMGVATQAASNPAPAPAPSWSPPAPAPAPKARSPARGNSNNRNQPRRH